MKIILEKGQKLFFTSDTHYSHANICSATTSWGKGEGNTRKFNSLEQMNNTLVSNINEVVGENDILFHLGDWSFGGFEKTAEFRDRINCKNIHLILGNHDHHIERNKQLTDRYYSIDTPEIILGDANENFYSDYKFGEYWNNRVYIQNIFSSVNRYLELQVKYDVGTPLQGEVNFVLMHYPIASWNNMNRGWIHLHGHVHLPSNKRIAQGRAMDVGVDGNNLKPVSLKDVLKLKKHPIKNLSLPVDHHEKEVN